MWVTFYIIAERPVKDSNLFPVGESLIDCGPVGPKLRHGEIPFRYLDTLAREAGVRSLSGFVCVDPESRCTEDAGKTSRRAQAISRWFAPGEGLESIRGLLDYLTVHTEAVAEVKRVLGDLRQFERVLMRLDTHRIRWHIEDVSWW
jgi:hypothetical protein